MGASESLLYFAGSRVEGASPSAGFERGPYLGDGQAGTQARGWCPTQDGQSVAICQVIEGSQRCRVVLAKGVA